ncbi:alpha/beta fold hydrolase [Streptomyces sp. NPDC013740]|uniref:alpha/beta fold hydrolase n=1 Tax=Streptomyces sp. NPDC013740 TaxID=3364867 RepID=UPI0036FA85B5
MPEDTTDNTFSSLVTEAVTDADLAHVAANGLWAADGTVDPDAVRIGQTLAAAMEPGGSTDLLTHELAELVGQVRGIALPHLTAIEADDGIRLSAFTLRQLAPGPHPLVVLPAGWSPFGWAPFMYAYLTLAMKGYHVIAYTPRGLGLPGLPSTSQGFVDVAGPNDWADGSAVIDYAVDHFGPTAIGFLGESYGSGISQLVAAHDDRVQAVVALSTWGDLATALYDNGVRHVAAVNALLKLTGGSPEDKFDDRNRAILEDFLAGRNMDAVVAWGRLRAPRSYVAQTEEHGTPTFYSNTWHEGLFAANQVVETFDVLRVPKRLNMWIGDHAAPEGAGLIAPPAKPGDVNIPLQEAYAWLDHHLKGERNGVEDWPAIVNQVMFTYRTVPVRDPETGQPTGVHEIVQPALRESRAEWGDVTTGTELLALTPGGGGGADGGLVPAGVAGPVGWERSFVAGVDTVATAMDRIMETGKKEWAGSPKVYDTRKVDRTHALVWVSEPLSGAPAGGGAAARRIRGIPRLRLTVRSTAPSASLFAYLFDVAEDETARIITHEPLNADGLTPGRERRVDWRLQAAAYDLPDGHRLMLVIDSKDPLYADVSVVWTGTVVSSAEDAPALLELPLG